MNILLSIKPEWAKLIYSGKKTIEFRHTVPRDYLLSCEKIFLYETSPVKKVTGYIVVNEFIGFGYLLTSPYIHPDYKKDIIKRGCINLEQIKKIIPNKKLWGWEISFKTSFPPRDLKDFTDKKPPQSWYYLKGV